MKFTNLLFVGAFIFTISGCSNFENAKPSTRETFVRFYEGPFSMTASSMEVISSGYVVLGNMQVELEDTTYLQTTIIETDLSGNRIGDFHNFDGGTGKAFKPLISNGVATGYIVVGDSIHVDPFAEQAANVSVASLRLLLINNSFEKVGTFYQSDITGGANDIKADFFGGAVTTNQAGQIILLGTRKEGVINQQNAPEKQLLIVLNSDFTIAWSNTFDLLDNTYQNTKSIHTTANGNIIWASAIADIQGEFNSSWITIPYVQNGSVFKNFDQLGQTTQQLFVPTDICPASSPAFGFGVIGTYSETTDGTKSNIFFLQVDVNGNIVQGSERYFDAIESPSAALSDKNISSIEDTGAAITATSDGGFLLAGSFVTTPQKGNGGHDIYLLKVDAFGNLQWSKFFGNAGDEVVSTVREAAGGDILVCGTNTLGDYSSIFLMKVDSEGNLDK